MKAWKRMYYNSHTFKHNLANESSKQQVKQKLYSSSIGRWKTDLSEDDLDIIYSVAGQLLETLGYM